MQDVVAQEAKEMRWGQFKGVLADAIIAHLEPIQQRFHEVMADGAYLDQVIVPAMNQKNFTSTPARCMRHISQAESLAQQQQFLA